ncbi:uncharacterized protein LOC124438814 [Xenia sp. Carnegie-2017]|uniref:uncharacterized protein LOC124438814 n=1 Tax=Xenia sp. Carnegie-2017 TaxID=2897299 RepID=UPI001F03CF8B|nr:uncharacterized protein LOC124438814 [Xenia sp. Carnegie-2017]
MSLAIVLYTFQGRAVDELSVEKNEILDVVDNNDENWWKVRNLYGRIGLVPVNYLAAPLPDREIAIISRGRTLARYESEDENVLSVYKGQQVTIFDKNDDYWWYVGIKGRIGYLPKKIIKDLKQSNGNDEQEQKKFSLQEIVPSKALCDEETAVLFSFQKPLPTKGQYLFTFKGEHSELTVLGKLLNTFTLKISTPIYYPAEKTKVTITYQQSGSPQQLIAKGIDFMFESNTDIVCHILEGGRVSLDFVQQLLEGIDSRKFEVPKKQKDLNKDEDFYDDVPFITEIMEKCYDRYIIDNYQYTPMAMNVDEEVYDDLKSIDDNRKDRGLNVNQRMSEEEVLLALLAKCVKAKRITEIQAQQIAKTLCFKTGAYQRTENFYKLSAPGNQYYFTKVEPVYEDIEDDNEQTKSSCTKWVNNVEVFKDRFLDEEYNLRDDIHDILKNLPWVCEAYGLLGPNENMPYEHLYVTVDNVERKSKDILRKEIDDVFGWEASFFIEIKNKPSKAVKFRLLSNLRPEDSTLPFNGDIHIQNNDSFHNDDFHVNSSSHGTLTMFCRNKENYYVLTCAHVARNENDGNKYFYQPPNCNKEKPLALGTFPCNTINKYNSEADIMCIPIGKKEDFQRLGGNEMKSLALNLKETNEELYETAKSKKGVVEVRTSNQITGYISERNFSFIDKSSKFIFKNAVKIKSRNPFLQNGDSGSLVYFKDRVNVWRPFAYAVCKIDDDDNGDDDVYEYDNYEDAEKYYLCLKLDKALKMLDFKNSEYFHNKYLVT